MPIIQANRRYLRGAVFKEWANFAIFERNESQRAALNVQQRKRREMSENIGSQSARIYQFPVGGRRSLAGNGGGLKPVTEVLQTTAAKVAHAGGWYHEEAIKEDAIVQDKR